MGTRNYTTDHPNESIYQNGYLWEDLNSTDDVGQAVPLSRRSDRTIQVTGTPGGATLVIEGSLDGTNYVTLSDLQGSALSFDDTALGSSQLEGVSELVTFIRPRITSGASGTTDLDVYLIESGAV